MMIATVNEGFELELERRTIFQYGFCFSGDGIAERSRVRISCVILGMFQEVCRSRIICKSLSGLLLFNQQLKIDQKK